MKVAFITLGCKVNAYDSSMMAQILKDKGCEIVEFSDMADVYIINSCTVTGTGDKKSRQMVGKAKKQNPNALVCMTGCYSQVASDEVKKLGVDLIIGTSNRHKIYELIMSAKNGQVVEVSDDLSEYEDTFSTLQDERTRAFVKIQDGCNRFCTYCIIPYARGKSRSRKMDSIINETKDLVNKGYKEFVLTGIHIASYGIDNGEGSLLDVIKQVSNIKGVKRLRLGSLEPLILTKEFCEEISKIDVLCKSFHVSIQSGCDRTLKRMGRKYNAPQLREFIANIREFMPNASVTTDIIVGFPDETDEDFKECVDFAKEIKLSKCHIFPYSMRTGTPASRMANQIQKSVKAIRAKELKVVTDVTEEEYKKTHIGKICKVLFEQEIEKNLWCGYTDTYIKVFSQGENLCNEILDIKLVENYKDGVYGEIIEK